MQHKKKTMQLLSLMVALLLTHLPFGGNAEEIPLVCDEIAHSSTLFEHFYCTISGMNVTHSDTVILGHPMSNQFNFMKFYDSHLLYIPHGIFEKCTILRSLDVSACHIIDIPRFTFNGAFNLTNLYISKNNLTQLTASVFTGAYNLMQLDLAANKITTLDKFAFAGLTRLTKLNLGENLIKTMPNEIFRDSIYIEWLDLHGNLFEYIEPAVFSHLTRLRDVDLAKNRLKRLHPQTFTSVFALQNLWLASNNLTEFQLANTSIMYQVHIENNRLTALSINVTKIVRASYNRISSVSVYNANHLELLELANNNISNIANLTKLENLFELSLSNNPIGTLNTTTFNALRHLRALYLRGIGLRRLSYGMFAKQTKLEKLDLSYNNLTELNLEMFIPYLSNLQAFYVGGNNLTELQGKYTFFYAFEKLQHLGLSNNRFNCTYLHWLLTPPNLPTSVQLYVERGNEGDIETSHIRDVSCVSEVRETLQNTRSELHNMTEMQNMLKSSLESMRIHERHLELYMSIFQYALLLICSVFGIMVVLHFYRVRRTKFQSRRGGSIVFHSSNTINTNIEQ